MKVFYEARLIALAPKAFTNNEGVEVEYIEAYFEHTTEEGISEVIVFNTKLDLSEYVNKEGVIEVDVDAANKRKTRLLDFKASK